MCFYTPGVHLKPGPNKQTPTAHKSCAAPHYVKKLSETHVHAQGPNAHDMKMARCAPHIQPHATPLAENANQPLYIPRTP